MLTVLKTKISHCCNNCDPGHWDVNNEEFSTWLEATETVIMATSLAVSMGFKVMAMKPGLVQLERTEDDVHDELTLELIADPIGVN
jgi:hypothetical protein